MTLPVPSRLPFIDLLRAGAAQLIVWHHLAFYGPLPDQLAVWVPALVDWLWIYARMAVQVFFVVGGFITALSLADRPAHGLSGLGRFVVRRYRRIGLPYLAALAVAIAANALARHSWNDPVMISAPPTLPQLLAHALFLQNILGYESLTAGIWYLAVDFQLGLGVALLFAGSAALSRAASGRFGLSEKSAAWVVLWLVALASLFWFNRDDGFDDFGIYFLGSYFAGMVAQRALVGRIPASLFGAYLALMVAAGLWDFRERVLIAAAVAALLFVAGRIGALERFPRSRLVAYLGRSSYSLFLIHFPVCLVVTAAAVRFFPLSPATAAVAVTVAWAGSLAASVLFHRFVEAPCAG